MTAVRTGAVKAIILAAAFAAGLSGAAMAGEKKQDQAGGTTPPTNVTTQADTNTSANTTATVHAVSVYLQWRKCLDNMLPQCP